MTTATDSAGYLVSRVWYGDSPLKWLLLPLSALYSLVIRVRAWLYRAGLFRIETVSVPVIVVGNITVGGTGKTPVTIWLCERLSGLGFRPGVISRGYGGKGGQEPLLVSPQSDARIVGDEAILIARRTGVPVMVHKDRIAAARAIQSQGVNVIISDDGLQHYRLGRDYEIVVIDGDRGFGNRRLLPAGPLRESASRLKTVDQILEQRSTDGGEGGVFRRRDDRRSLVFRLAPTGVTRLDGSETRNIESFSGTEVNAIAAIGNPARFFASLRSIEIKVNERPMRDHATISPADLEFENDLPVLMTEKDASKCREIDAKNAWYVTVDVEFDLSRGDAWVDYLAQRFASDSGLSLS